MISRGAIAGLALATITGCAGAGHVGTGTAGSSGPGVGGVGNSSGTAGSGSGTAGSSGGSTGTAGSGSPNFQLECSGAQLGRPFLRLLTGTELQNTLSDVFPEVKGMWTASLPSSQISSHGFDNDGGAQVGPQLAGAIRDAGLALATVLVGTPLATVLPCSTSSANHACAETFLNKYGQKL
ncbi:MAG TPA: DUF1587 domain-containing protein, partial [Polyangia bacterium]